MATSLKVLPYVLPYLDEFSEGVLHYASANRTLAEDVALIAAICLHESHAGRAPGYKPLGDPDGTGDWTVRTGGWLKRAGVKVRPDTDEERERLRAAGWSIPKDKATGEVKPGPYAIPADELGWGHGLLQADALGDFSDLISPAPWPVDRQAFAACAMLGLARRQLEPWRTTSPLYDVAVICRYNASFDRVRAGIEAGDPNIATTGGDYGKDVRALRDALRARYPERFPAPRITW